MAASAVQVELSEIQRLRAVFLEETNFQIRYNACHERGWTDSYLLSIDGMAVGYGSVKGREIPDRDTVFEYFVIPPFRSRAGELFPLLLAASNVRYIECQSNELLLTSMLYEFTSSVRADVMLFADHAVTAYTIPEAVVRPASTDDRVFEHTVEPAGDYVLEMSGEIVATGGFLRHYNPPFADLYMEVREDRRHRGFGTFLLQEVKKACYLAGRVPAARCDLTNKASRATLTKAGLRIAGFMLTGEVSRSKSWEQVSTV